MSIESNVNAENRNHGRGRHRRRQRLPENIRSIQPGGGTCMSLELLWGRWRRWYLRRFRSATWSECRARRVGEEKGYPHPILDPRDLKYYRNQGNLHWRAESDPFTWRDVLPFVRVGLAELVLLGGGFLLLAVALYFVYWPLALVPLTLVLEVVWFFRDPRRAIPTDTGAVVSPADGKVVSIDEIDHDELLGRPRHRRGDFPVGVQRPHQSGSDRLSDFRLVIRTGEISQCPAAGISSGE